MRTWLLSIALLSMTVLPACDGEPPCDRPCFSACDRYEVVACDQSCPAGTSEAMPACEDAAVPCEKSCWTDCPSPTTTVVACGARCPEGTTELPPPCDAGPLFDTGFDAGPPYHPCTEIFAVDVQRVMYDGPVVPEGSYWEEPPEEGTQRNWLLYSECADDIDSLREQVVDILGAEALTGVERTADQFYEVEAMGATTLYQYRLDRCDYFDGALLAGAPHTDVADLADLVGYLWFEERHLDPDSRLLEGVGQIDGDRITWTSCSAERWRPRDSGCDRIRVYERTWTLVDGIVTRDVLRNVRELDGHCF